MMSNYYKNFLYGIIGIALIIFLLSGASPLFWVFCIGVLLGIPSWYIWQKNSEDIYE